VSLPLRILRLHHPDSLVICCARVGRNYRKECTMSRKDYVKLAAALHWTRPTQGKASQYKPAEQRARLAAWESVRDELANVLARDNDSFDRDRFVRACESASG